MSQGCVFLTYKKGLTRTDEKTELQRVSCIPSLLYSALQLLIAHNTSAMIFTTFFTTLLFATSAFAVRAGYDTTYDDAGAFMNNVACSDGSNGLASRFPTFGSVPTFPNIGGASAIGGWNSPQCGTCWQLTYEGRSIFVTAIDHADDGFNLSQQALNTLTNGRAVEVGVVDVTATQVDRSACGL